MIRHFLLALFFSLTSYHGTTGFLYTMTKTKSSPTFGLLATKNDKEEQKVPVVMHLQELVGRHRWQQLQSLLHDHSHLIVGLENVNIEFGRDVLSHLFDSNTKHHHSTTSSMATTSSNTAEMNEYQLDQVLRSLGFVWLHQEQLNKVFPHMRTVKARDLKRLLMGNPHQLRNALLNLAAM